ncbi:MAG TPA: hypothetical protein VGB55_06390 [Tepidisphaeraceae bacterium]
MTRSLPTEKTFWLCWSVWAASQICVLALFAGRVKLSAGFPTPIESSAAVALIEWQLFSAALLAPHLLQNLRGFMMTVALAMPLLMLATLLSGQPARAAFFPGIVLVAWLGVIYQIANLHLLPLRASALTVLTLANAIGPILMILAAEFGDGRLPATTIKILSPTLSGSSTFLHFSNARWVWLVPACLWAVLAATGVRRITSGGKTGKKT